MSDVIYFSFKAREEDIPAWEKVFEVLESGHQGAKFQMAMEAFGQAVSDKLDDILENEEYFGPESFIFEGWNRKGNEFSFELDLPYELIDEFEALFRLCPVDKLDIVIPE